MQRDAPRRYRRGVILAAAGWLFGCGSEFAQPAPPATNAPCNGPGAFSDSFDDGVLSELFVTQGTSDTGQIEEREGTLVLTPDESAGQLSVRSVHAVDLRGRAVVVEVPETIDGAPGADSTFLELLAYDGSQLWMERSSTELEFQLQAEEGDSSSSTGYDAVAHRWWRIAEADGLLRFEASPDNQSWSPLYETPSPSFVEAVYLVLGAWYDGQTSAPGRARFDHLNPEGGAFCGLGQLALDFDEPPGRGWNLVNSNACEVTLSGGRLTAVVAAGGVGECRLTSLFGWGLRGQSLTLAFSELPAAASGARLELTVATASGEPIDRVSMSLRDGTLYASASIGATSGSGETALAAGPAWWRIGEQAGHLKLELSTDGSTFEVVHELIVGALRPAFGIDLRFYLNSASEQETRVALDAMN